MAVLLECWRTGGSSGNIEVR